MFRLGFFAINSPLILVLRNLRERWVRTLLTIAGIVVGVAAMVAVNATNNSTLASINSFFDEASGQSHLLVEAAVAGDLFALDVLTDVSRFPEVVAAAPSILGITVPADEADDYEEEYGAGGNLVPGTNFWLYGRDLNADEGIHEYKLVAGRLLASGEESYNLLLVDEYAREKGVELGERFAILTPSQGFVQLRVVGLIAKEGIGITNEGVVGIAPLAVVQELFDGAGQIDQIELVVQPELANDTAALEALSARLEERLGNGLDVKFPSSRGEQVTDSLASYQQGLNFFSVVSLFVGSFLIYNAFAMTVVERTREIGMLRALGTTRRQMMGMVLTEAGLLGVFGSVAGVGFGLLLARGLVVTMSDFAGRAVDQVIASPRNMVISIMVGVLVTLIASVVPAVQAARTSPMQALRVKGEIDEERWVDMGLRFGPLTVFASILILYEVPFRQDVAFYVGTNTIFILLLGATLCIPLLANPIERLVRPVILLVFGNEGRLGSSNISRSRGRTALTVAALMVGISMVVGINGLTDSFERDIDEWMDTALGGDLFVRSPLQMKQDVAARLQNLPEVTGITPSRFVSSRMLTADGIDEYAVFVAIDPESFTTVRGLRIQDGPPIEELMNELRAGDTVYIGADTANKYGLQVDDTIFLETRRGRRPFRIAAVVIDFAAGETVTITGSWNDLRRYFGLNDVSVYSVTVAEGASISTLTTVIEDEIGRGLNLSVENKEDFAAKVRELSSQAFSLFDVLGMIGMVVAALGVINTMLMNVLERTRELGGLRSLGMSKRQIRRMILAEASTMGFIGAVFGVAFGAVLADVFIIGLRAIGGFILSSRVPVQPMIYSFFIAFIVALLAAWYPAIRASRVNIIAAIKNE